MYLQRNISGGFRTIVSLHLPFPLLHLFTFQRDLMETTEIRGLHVDTSSTVEGGVEDAYGEDRATEDQLVTPWTVSVARFDLL